ncbi:hypothetical protein SLA2020_388340 [Shorea laevis]
MLALFFMIDPSVSLTPNSFTPPPPPPRFGHVRELCPLLLQCEHRRVMPKTTLGPVSTTTEFVLTQRYLSVYHRAASERARDRERQREIYVGGGNDWGWRGDFIWKCEG